MANAVELTVEQAWFIADTVGAGTLPWVLAITQPYADTSLRQAFEAERVEELQRLGVLGADGAVNPAVQQWIMTTCRARRWLELRFVNGSGDMLRGLVGRSRDGSGNRAVVALRSGGLVTLSVLDVDHPQALVPVLTAGLSGRTPARFDEFSIPVRTGARADEQLRSGTPLAEVVDFLGIPSSARPVVEAAYAAGRSYVEIVAGDHRDGHRISTEVGVSVVDTAEGRVVVAPSQAFDGEWVSTFRPGTPLNIATALERLTATLPDGVWFPQSHLTRDFDQRTEHDECRQTRTHTRSHTGRHR